MIMLSSFGKEDRQTNTKDFKWFVPHFSRSLIQQNAMKKYIVNNIPTELSHVNRPVYFKRWSST